MASLKRKRLPLSEKYKAITEMGSGTQPLKVAEKYVIPRNTISTWLLPGNNEKIRIAFLSGEVSTKRKTVGVSLRTNR